VNDPRLTQLKAELSRLAAQDPHALSDDQVIVSTDELLTLRNQLDAVIATQTQVIHTRDLTVEDCGLKTKNWMVAVQTLSQDEATTFLTVAKALPFRPHVTAALLAGDISLQHARRIITSTKKLPPELQDVFEKELVDAARTVDPTTLGVFARELRSRLGADETREAAEQRQYADRWLQLDRTYDGMTSITGMLDPASAAVVETALAPLMSKAGTEDDRTTRQRRADALTSIAALALRTGTLPDIGGQKPHLIATVAWNDLKNALDSQASALLNDYLISISTARMIACDAGLIPAVLGSNSEVLDLGRKTPNWSVAQHRALELESDGHCGFPGCGVLLAYCQIHHIHHRAHLGPTDKDNGIHLCLFHHWLIHHSNWEIAKTGPGKLRAWRN
jgi:Domain of unknown function (DUF222)